MLVKTPNKKKKTTPNRRKASNGKQKKKTKNKANGSGKNQRNQTSDRNKKIPLFNVKPWKIILGVIVLGILGVLYLKHVFATQELLHEVEQLEQQYEQIKRKHDYYKLTYDRMIGPKAIYDKAKAAGFIDGGPAEKVIEVEPVE